MDFDFQHWQKEYTQNTSDYSANQVKLIFRRQVRNFNLGAGGGYQNRSFDDPGLDDQSVFTYNLDLVGNWLIENLCTRGSVGFEEKLNYQS